MVLHRSMVDWRREVWGQSAMGICAFSICETYLSVVVLHRFMVNWMRW